MFDEQFEEAIIQAHTHMRCVDRQHESYECTLEALDKARDYYTKTYGNSNGTNRLLADVVDSLEFIADSLSEEALLRQMIDDWCIKQLGNTEKSLEVADKMFTTARDIFYNIK